jgi:hypothetical protein
MRNWMVILMVTTLSACTTEAVNYPPEDQGTVLEQGWSLDRGVSIPDGRVWSPDAKLRGDGVIQNLDNFVPEPDVSLLKPDQETTPQQDQALPNKVDVGIPPTPDKGVPPKLDKGTTPDTFVPPKTDKGVQCADCKIGGICIAQGVANPSDACQWCNISQNRYVWSPKPNGTACDDKVDCSFNDVCTNGTCQGTAYGCSWPAGGCASNMCTGKTVGTPPQGECKLNLVAINACLINGACYVKGDKHPDSGCVQCDPTQNKLAWTLTGKAGAGCGGIAGGCTGGGVCYFPNGGTQGYCQCSCKLGMTPMPCTTYNGGTTCKQSPTTNGYFCFR